MQDTDFAPQQVGGGATRRHLFAAVGALSLSAASTSAQAPAATVTGKKTVGVVLYPKFEVLDVFGPVEMWANVPDWRVIFVAQHAGPVLSTQKVAAVADYSFETAPQLDIMMVPGGIGSFTELENPVLLDFIRAQDRHTALTTSVCTGSWLLAKAGLLEGRRATSNKGYFHVAETLPAKVNWIKHARWVEDGKYITASGVSAGIDMSLGVVARLYGTDYARKKGRSLEYVWSEDPNNDPFAVA